MADQGSPLETIKDRASELASSVASTAESAWDSTRSMAGNVASTAREAWDTVSGFVRRHPIATFCVGAGLALVLASFLMGRTSSGRGRRSYPDNISP